MDISMKDISVISVCFFFFSVTEMFANCNICKSNCCYKGGSMSKKQRHLVNQHATVNLLERGQKESADLQNSIHLGNCFRCFICTCCRVHIWEESIAPATSTISLGKGPVKQKTYNYNVWLCKKTCGLNKATAFGLRIYESDSMGFSATLE